MTENDEKQNNRLNSNFTSEAREMRSEIQPTKIKNKQATNANQTKSKTKIKKNKRKNETNEIKRKTAEKIYGSTSKKQNRSIKLQLIFHSIAVTRTHCRFFFLFCFLRFPLFHKISIIKESRI